jgi:hypothetical protein
MIGRKSATCIQWKKCEAGNSPTTQHVPGDGGSGIGGVSVADTLTRRHAGLAGGNAHDDRRDIPERVCWAGSAFTSGGYPKIADQLAARGLVAP